jgi:nitrite reductase/ring-hydroxylating ferredoxin subunit
MTTKDATILPGRGPLAEVDVSELTEDGDALRFEYTDRLGQPGEGFVMMWQGDLVAYENRCPHWSVPVGYEDERFLGPNGRDIVCPMHGARFKPDTGECWSGPCLGDGLEKFEVERDGDVATIRRSTLRVALI